MFCAEGFCLLYDTWIDGNVHVGYNEIRRGNRNSEVIVKWIRKKQVNL